MKRENWLVNEDQKLGEEGMKRKKRVAAMR